MIWPISESGTFETSTDVSYSAAFGAKATSRLAQHYRPIPESPHSDEAKFTKYATAACDCAKALAPYQSPTLRAIVVSPPPPTERPTKRFTLTIFDKYNGAHEPGVDDEVER